MSGEGIERRRFPRYQTAVDVTVYQGVMALRTRIVQISRCGCLVFPPISPVQGSEVKLSFRVAEDLPLVNCKGEIVYTVKDKGTGIAFTEISLYNQDLITDYFERLLRTANAHSV